MMDVRELIRNLDLLTHDQLIEYLKSQVSYLQSYPGTGAFIASLDHPINEEILLNITLPDLSGTICIDVRFLKGREPINSLDQMLRDNFDDYDSYIEPDDVSFFFRGRNSTMDRLASRVLIRICAMLHVIRTFDAYKDIKPHHGGFLPHL